MTQPTETPEVQAAIEKVRPLNATQAKALRTLVQEDFAGVERDMKSLFDSEVVAIKQRIEDEYKDRGMDAQSFTTRARRLVSDFTNAQRALMDEARMNGASLRMPTVSSRFGYTDGGDGIEVEVDGQKAAVAKAVAEADRNYRLAQNALLKKQAGVERRILVAQVTGNAEDLLASLPSAESLMLEAAQEHADRMYGKNGVQQIEG